MGKHQEIDILTAPVDMFGVVANFLIAGNILRIVTTDNKVIALTFPPSEWKSFENLMKGEFE